jgi:hypothetical protein
MSSEFRQDEIADKFLKGKRNGFFVDIGASYYEQWNNTFFLEKEREYRGIAVEMNSDYAAPWAEHRPNTVMYNSDATALDYAQILADNNAPDFIDFLSIDIDPNTATWEALKKVMDTKYTFGVIAFEVDYGGDLNDKERFSVRDPSRALLSARGYVLAKEVLANGGAYHVDDIWVHKSIYDYEVDISL